MFIFKTLKVFAAYVDSMNASTGVVIGRTGRFIASMSVGVVILSIFLCSPVSAYTVVTISTAAPSNIEQSFIASATTQWSMSYFKNPLASNTYQLTLFGPNPNYNPLPTPAQLLISLVTVDSFTYVYGWAAGEVHERNQDIAMLTNATVACSTDTVCTQAIGQAINSIYTLNFSTPTVVPGF